jgi:hypothetical protein
MKEGKGTDIRIGGLQCLDSLVALESLLYPLWRQHRLVPQLDTKVAHIGIVFVLVQRAAGEEDGEAVVVGCKLGYVIEAFAVLIELSEEFVPGKLVAVRVFGGELGEPLAGCEGGAELRPVVLFLCTRHRRETRDVERGDGKYVWPVPSSRTALSPPIMSAEQTTSFSSTGDDVIARTIEIDQVHTRAGDLDDFYEIQRTADEIVAGDFKRVSNLPSSSILSSNSPPDSPAVPR